MTTTRIPATSAATTLTSPADALHEEEVARTRAFLRTAWIASACGVAMMYALPGDRQIALALSAVLGVTVLGSFATYLRLRNPENYDARQLNILAFAAILCTQLGILYTGAFSAAPCVVAFGIFFFCRTERFASAPPKLSSAVASSSRSPARSLPLPRIEASTAIASPNRFDAPL